LVRLVVLCVHFLVKTELRHQGNGGDGGDGSSGSAYAFGPGAKAYSGPGGNAAGGDVGRRSSIDVRATIYPRVFPGGKYSSDHPGKYPKDEAEYHDHDKVVEAWSGTLLGCHCTMGFKRRTQETVEMVVMPNLGMPTPMAMVRLHKLALVAMHLGDP
jgi:hypothetical protein